MPRERCGQTSLNMIAMLEEAQSGASVGQEASSTVSDDVDITRGRDAGRQLAWSDVYESLSRADEAGSLLGDDLELLAAAAYLLGQIDECRRALQRAHRVHVASGDARRATRCVFWWRLLSSSRGALRRRAVGLQGPNDY
jgi:hypothetical protein